MKEAFYFSHDANARNDEKIIALRIKHDWKGYGIFWAIIEKMRDSTSYQCIKDYNLIAFDLRVDAALIKSIVEEFGLFVFTEDGKYFYSERLKDSMEIKELKSQKASESAKKRWEISERNANALPTLCAPNAIKEKKGKEIKEKKEVAKIEIPSESSTHPPEILDSYKKFNDWLKENTPRVLELKTQISIENFIKLKKAYPDMIQPVKTLKSMHNYKPLTKNYVDVYLTLKKWMAKDEAGTN